MSPDSRPSPVAIIGAGLAGASCALGLRQADAQVTVFERSPHVGGRMATRDAIWRNDAGVPSTATFDHGAQSFPAVRPRFKSVMARAVSTGHAARWQPVVHSSRSAGRGMEFVPTPTASTLAGHLLAGSRLHLQQNVRRLQRTAEGAWFIVADGAALAGPFQHVVLAVPPAQAAVLLAGHRDDWAGQLAARRMDACWTLMAVTDDVDWPWDAAEPDRGPLGWIARNDRVPGRNAPPGMAVWTAHSTSDWSAGRLDMEPESICRELQSALAAQLPSVGMAGRPWRWHHAAVHRWSHAGVDPDGVADFSDGVAWWDAALGLGVCGDWLAGGGVESAWHSGDELADAMAASLEQSSEAPPASVLFPLHLPSVSPADDHLVTG